MAAALAFAPFSVYATSNHPQVREAYGEPCINVPTPAEVNEQLLGAVCCCGRGESENRDVPLKMKMFPTPTSPRMEATKGKPLSEKS